NRRAAAHRKTARLHLFAAFAGSPRSPAALKSVSVLCPLVFRHRAPPVAPAFAQRPHSDLEPESQQAARDFRCSKSSAAPVPARPAPARTISQRNRASFGTWPPIPCLVAAGSIQANRLRHEETARSQRFCGGKTAVILALSPAHCLATVAEA